MEQELRVALLAVAPLAAVSVAAFARWIILLRRRGDGVEVGHFGVPDLMLTTALGVPMLLGMVLFFSSGVQAPQQVARGELGSGIVFQEIALLALFGYVVYRKISLRNLVGWGRLSPLKTLGYAALFLVSALPLILCTSLLGRLFYPEEKEQAVVNFVREAAKSGDSGSIVAIVFSAALLAPIVEEFFFRGFFYGSLKRFCGPVPAVLITAALFALVHANVLALAPLFFLALAFTVAYEWTGSLLVPFTMHLLFNGTNIVLMLLQVKYQAP